MRSRELAFPERAVVAPAPAPARESSSSSSSESSIHEHTRPKHTVKPPKYDGTGSFESFLAQFQNCASYNKWSKRKQLVYLWSSLEKSAGQVLWDYSAETTGSLSKMIKVLKVCFDEASQSDKYRLKLKSRRRRPNETLRNPHSDIRQLTELAKQWHATTSLTQWTILTSLSKFASAHQKTLTRHYESLSSWMYGIGMSSRAAEGSARLGK